MRSCRSRETLARDFYAEMCVECWDVRTLRKKIGSMLFERTALSQRPKAVARPLASVRRRFKLRAERIVNRESAVDHLAGLQVFGIESGAVRFEGRRNDQRIVNVKTVLPG